jgi:hypothetical protein
MLSIKDIQDAAERIRGFVHRTPLVYSNSFSKMTGAKVYIKAENLQKTGSFKVRGAFNKMTYISSGNVDFSIIDRIIQKGLVTSGRVGVFEVTVDDVPGSLHSLTGIISSHRSNILDVVHDRFAENLTIDKTRVGFIVETRSKEHLEKILSDIVDKGFTVRKRTEN